MRDEELNATDRRLARALGGPRETSTGWVPAGADRRISRAAEQVADRLPPAWRGARWAAPARVAGAALLLALVVVGVAIARAALQPDPQALPVPPAAPAQATGWTGSTPGAATGSATGTASGVAVSPSPAELVVDVAGRVRSPGVVRVPAGARVQDAIAAAGGAARSADLAAVNLARPLVDGEQIVVPRPGQQVAAGGPIPPVPGASADAGTQPSVLDLNTADATALDGLPGIGPVLAQRILDLRQQRGRFSQVEELNDVPGIGEHVMGQLRSLVRV